MLEFLDKLSAKYTGPILVTALVGTIPAILYARQQPVQVAEGIALLDGMVLGLCIVAHCAGLVNDQSRKN